MDSEERIINSSEYIIYEVVDALENQYGNYIPKHIRSIIRTLKEELTKDLDIPNNESRDYKEVQLVQRVYYED